jgi:hypothetical protein
MRSLIILCVAVALTWADEVCDCEARSRQRRSAGDFAYTLAGIMADTTTLRINDLIKQTEELESRINSGASSKYSELVGTLRRNVEQMEAPLCKKNEFSCGRYSGQCVRDVFVCDRHNDCVNGHDEDEKHVCADIADDGRVWNGRIHWEGCSTAGWSDMKVVLIGSKRLNAFPSQVKTRALITVSHEDNGRTKSKTFKAQGFYSFAHKRLTLEPMDSHMDIGMTCEIADKEHAICHVAALSDGHHCGTVTMYRLGN